MSFVTAAYRVAGDAALLSRKLKHPAPGEGEQRIAATRSDTEAAERMQQAKRRLFAPLRPPAGGPWK